MAQQHRDAIAGASACPATAATIRFFALFAQKADCPPLLRQPGPGGQLDGFAPLFARPLAPLGGAVEGVFTDADGDGRRLYWISDIGPGDTYRIPTATYYAR